MLLRHSTAIIDYADQYGWTALHASCVHSNVEVVRLLLAAGADPIITNTNGKSCHQVALESNKQDRVALLKVRRLALFSLRQA